MPTIGNSFSNGTGGIVESTIISATDWGFDFGDPADIQLLMLWVAGTSEAGCEVTLDGGWTQFAEVVTPAPYTISDETDWMATRMFWRLAPPSGGMGTTDRFPTGTVAVGGLAFAGWLTSWTGASSLAEMLAAPVRTLSLLDGVAGSVSVTTTLTHDGERYSHVMYGEPYDSNAPSTTLSLAGDTLTGTLTGPTFAQHLVLFAVAEDPVPRRTRGPFLGLRR